MTTNRSLRIVVVLLLAAAGFAVSSAPAEAHAIGCATSASVPFVVPGEPGSVDVVVGEGNVTCSAPADSLVLTTCVDYRLVGNAYYQYYPLTCFTSQNTLDQSWQTVYTSAVCIEGTFRYRTRAISTKTHGNTTRKVKRSSGVNLTCTQGRFVAVDESSDADDNSNTGEYHEDSLDYCTGTVTANASWVARGHSSVPEDSYPCGVPGGGVGLCPTGIGVVVTIGPEPVPACIPP